MKPCIINYAQGIANRLGMQFLVPHETYFSYWAPVVKDSVVLLVHGM